MNDYNERMTTQEEKLKNALLHSIERESGRKPTHLERIGGTISSSLYFVDFEDGTKAVLKGSLWYKGFAEDPAHVLESVYTVADALKRREIPLQGAIRLPLGRFTFTAEGLQYALLDYVSGHAFSGSEAELRAAGNALGRFHKEGSIVMQDDAVKTAAHAIPFEMPYEESLAAYRSSLRAQIVTGHDCQEQDTCTALRNRLEEIDREIAYVESAFAHITPVQTLLHNDFHASNGLYTEEGTFAGFLDIDQLGYGEAISDFGNTLVSLVGSLPSETTSEQLQQRVTEFIRAYHRIHPLSLAEYAAAPAAGMRWNLLRILRSTRRHYNESNRFPELHRKSPMRIDKFTTIKTTFAFMTPEWIQHVLQES